LAAVLAVAGVTIWMSVAKAQTQTIEYRSYGIVGITAGQTMRVNVVTVGITNDVPVELVILDAQGAVVGRMADRAVPGRALSLDARYAPLEGTRQRLRALVRWGTQAAKGGYVQSSWEVIDDASGKTVLGHPNPEG
jgi:hypothetical protein